MRWIQLGQQNTNMYMLQVEIGQFLIRYMDKCIDYYNSEILTLTLAVASAYVWSSEEKDATKKSK